MGKRQAFIDLARRGGSRQDFIDLAASYGIQDPFEALTIHDMLMSGALPSELKHGGIANIKKPLIPEAIPLVKQFVIDDPTTYLTDESQMKGMLLATIEGETPKVDEEILKWQYPGLGAATLAGAVPGAGELYKTRRGVGPTGPIPGVGKARAALGIKGVLGKAFGATFSPLAAAATLPISVAAQRKGGTEWGDIATDPTNWMAPAFASAGAEMATRGMKPTGILAKAIRMGMSPRTLSLISRRFGFPGLAVSAGMWGYDKWKNRSINDED